MDFSNLNFLIKLGSCVQVTAIVLIFLGGALQASRFYIDHKINELKAETSKTEKIETGQTIENLEKTISDQTQKIDQQSQQIETQKKKVQEVVSKTQPRSIPPEIIPQLTTELSKHKGEKIQITCVMGDQESFHFASELKNIFLASGWEVDGVNQAVYTKPIKGLIIVLRNEETKPKAEYLFHVFGSLGHKSVGEINNSSKTDIGIVVGAKR